MKDSLKEVLTNSNNDN